MPQLSDILRIAGGTTCTRQAQQRPEHADGATIDLTMWHGSATTIMHAGLAAGHPMTTMRPIDVSDAQGSPPGIRSGHNFRITIMATQNLSDDYSNGPLGRPKECRTTRVNGHGQLVHRYTDLKLKRMKDCNKLCLITEHLAKFAPKTVKRLMSANPEEPALSKHEEDVSVLFVDICDYTRLSESLPLRALNRLVEQYFSTFLNQIHEADGDINEIAGDGFMAIFQDTDPQKHAIKAAHTSLALLDATTALNRQNRQQPLAVHMGLNSGLALVGVTRLEGLHESRWTFTASGPMTNLAARLACIAKPAQILVGPESVARLGRHYDVRKLMRTHLKNMTNPIDIYRLVGSCHSLSPRG